MLTLTLSLRQQGQSLPQKPSTVARLSPFLPVNDCKVEFAVTHSKQTTGAKSTGFAQQPVEIQF